MGGGTGNLHPFPAVSGGNFIHLPRVAYNTLTACVARVAGEGATAVPTAGAACVRASARMAAGSQGAERASPLRRMSEGAEISPVTPGAAGGRPSPPGAGGSVRGRGGSRSRAAVAVFEGWAEAQEVGVEDPRLPRRCIVAAERGRRPAGTVGAGSSHRRCPHPSPRVGWSSSGGLGAGAPWRQPCLGGYGNEDLLSTFVRLGFIFPSAF